MVDAHPEIRLDVPEKSFLSSLHRRGYGGGFLQGVKGGHDDSDR